MSTTKEKKTDVLSAEPGVSGVNICHVLVSEREGDPLYILIFCCSSETDLLTGISVGRSTTDDLFSAGFRGF